VDAWNVVVERRIDTESSILLFGRSGAQPVVLKLARHPGGEWSSGPVLEAFGGLGVVRALDHVEGAVLLEQLCPGDSLATLTLEGKDDNAWHVLAQNIRPMLSSDVCG
jgi:streptomycin 6-kinase